jgi:hypothetical protein
MCIDHIGAILFPQILWLRLIGRIAFPIFAYTLSEGFVYTKNIKKYMLRIAMLAVLSEVPFDLAFYGTAVYWRHQNIFFTLLIGLLTLWAINTTTKNWLKCIYITLFALLAEILYVDYGGLGILIIFWCFSFREHQAIQYLGVALINIFLLGGAQVFAPIALIPIAMHNHKLGKSCKMFFYYFYPIHLVIILIIKIFLF